MQKQNIGKSVGESSGAADFIVLAATTIIRARFMVFLRE